MKLDRAFIDRVSGRAVRNLGGGLTERQAVFFALHAEHQCQEWCYEDYPGEPWRSEYMGTSWNRSRLWLPAATDLGEDPAKPELGGGTNWPLIVYAALMVPFLILFGVMVLTR